jgi:glycosyltransferase involved in cell wall biosynthesis
LSASHRAPADGGELDVTVVLPVYNEQGHLRTEIDRIRAALEASPFSFEIVVVDDGSDDGSGEQLRRIEGIRRRPPRRPVRAHLQAARGGRPDVVVTEAAGVRR